MTVRWPTKDPGEKIDYSLDWSARLGEDTIVASSWVFPDDLTDSSPAFDDTTTTVWIEGGTVGVLYVIVNTITTAAGRVLVEPVRLRVLAAGG